MSLMMMYPVFIFTFVVATFASRKDLAAPSTIDIDFKQIKDELAELSESEMLDEEVPMKPEKEEELDENGPALIPLRRESVPVKRKGKVVSFKTSYSGVISVGAPAQAFRVVFDTGSGHLILPSVECPSEACLVHRQYNQTASDTAIPINADGSIVPPGEVCDQVDIGFGTGKVKGEFVRDVLCLGNVSEDSETDPHCVTIQGVMAIEMSTMPFKNFGFDGILGMGLATLALADEFSFFDILSKSGRVSQKHFGVFLTDGEEGMESEIAIGGHNPSRLLEGNPIAWTDVVNPELGYWQVKILALRVGGQTLDVCQDGTCRGVVDTGTSHLGIPAPYDQEVVKMLTTDAGDMLDCRLADLPELEIELPGMNITLYPETYMRRLPLREDVNVDSTKGVTMPTQEELEKSELGTTTTTTAIVLTEKDAPGSVARFCRPRLMPVNMPAPLGPNLFILGEPILHRYYTVFDWNGPRIGMGVANKKMNMMDRSQITDRIGALPQDMDVYLMQQSTNSSHRTNASLRVGTLPPEVDGLDVYLMQQFANSSNARMAHGHFDDTDRFVTMQVVVQVAFRYEVPVRC